MTVAEHIAIARHAHQEYRENVARRVQDGPKTRVLEGNPAIARAALKRAYDALLAAELLDPLGVDPAWTDSPDTALHYDMLAFYRRELEKA